MIKPWRATCVQVPTKFVYRAGSRDEAQAIINRSLDRWEELISVAAMRGGDERQLLLFPEFAMTGFPIKEDVKTWIDKACSEIPGPITERLQKQAQQHGVYIGANAYEHDPEWPGRYFNCSFLIEPRVTLF